MPQTWGRLRFLDLAGVGSNLAHSHICGQLYLSRPVLTDEAVESFIAGRGRVPTFRWRDAQGRSGRSLAKRDEKKR
jgi:hypothetical protein